MATFMMPLSHVLAAVATEKSQGDGEQVAARCYGDRTAVMCHLSRDDPLAFCSAVRDALEVSKTCPLCWEAGGDEIPARSRFCSTRLPDTFPQMLEAHDASSFVVTVYAFGVPSTAELPWVSVIDSTHSDGAAPSSDVTASSGAFPPSPPHALLGEEADASRTPASSIAAGAVSIGAEAPSDGSSTLDTDVGDSVSEAQGRIWICASNRRSSSWSTMRLYCSELRRLLVATIVFAAVQVLAVF